MPHDKVIADVKLKVLQPIKDTLKEKVAQGQKTHENYIEKDLFSFCLKFWSGSELEGKDYEGRELITFQKFLTDLTQEK